MKNWKIAALAVALLCFGAVSVAGNVGEAVAASTKDGKQKAASKDAKSKKQTVAKDSKSKSTVSKDKKSTAAKDKKKQAVASKDKSKKQTASARSKSKNKKMSKPKATSERDIWMQRAQNSSDLLGKASWYGSDFHGGLTASGAEYDMNSYTAAHRTLPLGTVVEVTAEDSGRSVLVCINNRGPFKAGRVIDLSQAAAKDLGIKQRGIAPVNLTVVTDAEGQPLNSDEAFYVRLMEKQNAQEERVGPFTQYADASVMQDVLRNQYPEASIVRGPAVASK